MSAKVSSNELLEDFSSKIELNQRLSADQDRHMANTTVYSQGDAMPTNQQVHHQGGSSKKMQGDFSKADALVQTTPRTMLGNRISSPKSYQVEHLASFQHESATSQITPDIAVQRLTQISEDGGLFSQLMVMKLTDNSIIMLNGETMEVIEEYALENISLSACITSHPLIGNLFVFSTKYSTDKVGAIHLFHCKASEASSISEDLEQRMHAKVKGNMSTALVNGGYSGNEPVKINGHSLDAQIKPDVREKNEDNLGYSNDEHEPSSPTRGAGVHHRVEAFQKIADSPRQAEVVRTSSKSSFDYGTKEMREAKVNRDVQILNHCIDEIEAFVISLRKMNEARKRLSHKGTRKSLKKKYEPLRTLAKGPDEKTVVDIYQKFKFSFVLLGKLKPHISNPNAPELIHYLIVPLKIIVKVLGLEGARKVESPLLTSLAIDLLSSCLKTEDQEFWKSLGQNWCLPMTAPVFKNKGPPSYIPVFKDGWTPPEIVVDERSAAAAKSAAIMVERMKIVEEEEVHKKAILEDRQAQVRETHYDIPVPQPEEKKVDEHKEKPTVLPKLQLNADTRQALVVYDYWAHNNKELTIRAGEKVLILDDSRRWWLVKNRHEEKGYVPSTVLEVSTSDNSSETSADSSASPASSPSVTKGITLSTQLQESKVERRVIEREAVSPQPAVITATSIINESSQFSNPSSPVNPSPPKEGESEVIEVEMKLDDPPDFHPPPMPPPEDDTPTFHPPPPTEPIVLPAISLQSSSQPSSPSPAQPPSKPQSKPPSQPPLQSAHPPIVVSVSESQTVTQKAGNAPEISLQQELNDRLQKQETSQATLSAVDRVDFFIPLFKSSTADDVSRWLKRLNFAPLTVERLSGVAAKELFKLPENELVERLGEDEGKRLYNELQVQTGAMTRHKTMTEFQKALLERMKRQETIKKNITMHQVTVKTNSDTAALTQDEMKRKFKEQQDLINAQKAADESRQPEKHTFVSFQGGTDVDNNNKS